MKGFTLVELILYLGIVVGLSTSLVFFSISITNSRNKIYVGQEVNGNARTGFNLITQRIRAATDVNVGASVFDTDPGVLSLVMADAAKNPTVIALDQDNGVLQITEGVGSPRTITTDEVNVTNLVFRNMTGGGNRQNIRVELRIEYDNPSGDVRFNYAKNWRTTVSLRQ